MSELNLSANPNTHWASIFVAELAQAGLEAVCLAPGSRSTPLALAFLRRVEPAPRGWYAAPIGWLDSHGDGVFAVAIRSAVTQHERAWLYAGAGIVADSAAEREWAETELKFRPMLGALGVENV